MTTASFERLGTVCFVTGSVLLAAYAALFPLLLPIAVAGTDFPRLVLSPSWAPLTLVALVGVVLMVTGLDAVYSRIRAATGLAGTIGFLITRVAFLLQACVLTWELLLDPIMAAHPESAFLLRDRIIIDNSAVTIFRWTAIVSILVGTVLFGFAIYRSKQFPGIALVLMSVGAMVYAVGPMISVFVAVGGIVTFAVGCLLIGLRLWRVETATSGGA